MFEVECLKSTYIDKDPGSDDTKSTTLALLTDVEGTCGPRREFCTAIHHPSTRRISGNGPLIHREFGIRNNWHMMWMLCSRLGMI